MLLVIWGKYTGGHWLYTDIIESHKCVRCRPTSSSTDVCYRGAPRQCPRRSNASRRVCSYSEGAQKAPSLVCQDNSIHYPVGKSLFVDSLLFLLSSEADKELVWGPEALSAVHVNAQGADGTEQSNGWVCFLPGQVYHLFTTWSLNIFFYLKQQHHTLTKVEKVKTLNRTHLIIITGIKQS